MRRWIWRHPTTVCIGSLWLLEGAVLLVVTLVHGRSLPDSPPPTEWLDTPHPALGWCLLNCVQSPRAEFMDAAMFIGAFAAVALVVVGGLLGLLLEKSFFRRAERLTPREPATATSGRSRPRRRQDDE